MKEHEGTFLDIDFGIITALPIERDAVLECLGKYDKEQHEQLDIRTYYRNEFHLPTGSYLNVVALSSDMGIADCVAVTTDLIRHWNPRYIVMIGIAGGFLRDGMTFGDVVVADQVIEYEYAKIFDTHTELRPRVHRCDPLLLDRVKGLSKWSCSLKAPLLDPPIRPPRLHIGPIASGNKVVASELYRDRIKSINPCVLAVEMEGEGVMTASWQLPRPKGALIIRGISDLADRKKNDSCQAYAANAAAHFFKYFLLQKPIEFRKHRERPFDVGRDSDRLDKYYKQY